MILKLLFIISSIQIYSNTAQNFYNDFVTPFNAPRSRNWNGMQFSKPVQSYYSVSYDPYQEDITDRPTFRSYSPYLDQPVGYFNPNERRNNLPADNFRMNPIPQPNNDEFNSGYVPDDGFRYPNTFYDVFGVPLPPRRDINYDSNTEGYNMMFPVPENGILPNPFVNPFGNSYVFEDEPSYGIRNARKLSNFNIDKPILYDTINSVLTDNNLNSNSFERKNNDGEQQSESASFGYHNNGTYLWPINFPTCGGKSQSPIDIKPYELKPDHLTNLKWINYGKLPSSMRISNNGHTLELSAEYSKLYFHMRPYITGGPLKNKRYIFYRLHFHWGSTADQGSEHTVNGRSYPLELHLVHYQEKYKNLENALNEPDGLAVVAFMFNLYGDNKALELILNNVTSIRQPNQEKKLQSTFRLSELIKTFADSYVTYQGSLTTPPCNEVVTWIISSRSLPTSECQLAEFRKLESLEGGPLEDNFRPTQDLNERPVYFVK